MVFGFGGKSDEPQPGGQEEIVWQVLHGELDGKPMFVRRAEVPSLAGDSRLGLRLGIAVPLLRPDERGLPVREESAELSDIEDAVVASLPATKQGVLVLAITTGSMREFVLYVRSRRDVARVVQAAEAVAGEHEIQHHVEPDPEWNFFREFL